MKSALYRHLPTTAAAFLAAALAEGAAVALRSSAAKGWSLVWCVGLWAVPAALAMVPVSALLALLCGDQSLAERARQAWSDPRERLTLWLGLLGSSALFAWVFVVARSMAQYRNVELAAALTGVAVWGGVIVLSVSARAAARALPARRALPALSVCAALGTATWVALACWPGLVQLDARLLLAPGAFLAVLVATDRYLRDWIRVALVGATLGAVALLSGAAFWMRASTASAALASHGAWSPPLIAALRRLSDFDGDGYSGILGGGDCAPLDAERHPGALEVPGDGLDNNCIGGDAGNDAAPHKPIWGASVHGSPTNQNVVVITIETLRHDHASFVAAARDTTPRLRQLGSSSLVFERMYSAAPYTRLALASLFSSFAPSEVQWLPQAPQKRALRIGPRTPWLPELLSARGYETIAVLTDFSAFTPEESIGFERGFRHYDVSTKLGYRGGTMWGFPAAEQVDKAIGYVERARAPFFLWLHLFEPHYRYEQPPGAPVFGNDEQARYDAEIWHVDQQLGRLLDVLRERNLWDSTVLFVSGDHGESFGEHEDRWHGTNLFDPQLRPPALLRVPGVAAQRVDVSVTFTDIAPTLARLLGDRETFDQLRGRSLAPLLHHRRLPDGDNSFIAETFTIHDGRSYQAALVAYPLKLIYSEDGQRFSLFDLTADAGEQRPLDPRADPRGIPLLQRLIGYVERNRPHVRP